MNGRLHTKSEYEKVMKLLKIHKNVGKVKKITGIPRSTIRNWKLNYVNPPGTKRRISEDIVLPKIEMLVRNNRSVSEIARELNIPYNSALLIVKKNFMKIYENKLKRQFHKLTKQQKHMTPELAYIFGVMFGDGCAKEPYRISLYVIDKDFRDNFAKMVNDWCGLQPWLCQRISRNRLFYQCNFNSKDVRGFFNDAINKKRIPNSILNSKKDTIKKSFIRGFVDSEGSVKKYCISVSNKNTTILNSIMNMLIDLGFDKDHLRITRANKNNVYNLDISTKNNMKLYRKLIGFSIQRKQNKLEAVVGI